MSTSTAKQPKKILLLIRSLNIGGAERQVVSIAKTISSLGTEVHVAVKASGGPLESDLADVPNVNLHHLGEQGIVGQFKYFLKLRKLIKSNQYDAVYGFMPLPNLALLVARTLRNRPLIAWGVRSSDVDPTLYNSRVKWTMRLEKLLSRFSDRVITNSQAALEEYRLNDYPYAKLSHIPNAIDIERFRPNPEARKILEAETGIQPDSPVIGIFARIHPMKGHLTFLKAASALVKRNPNVRFICAGEDPEGYAAYASRIRQNATERKLDDHIIWLGPRKNPEYLMAACDVTTLTSDSGEGFPNSVAESLACGTPCVVTDVGDGPVIVNDSTAVVARGDSSGLAQAWQKMLNNVAADSAATEAVLRSSIVDRYSPEQIGRETLSQLAERPA
ncbi:glycosyltransferase [Candidatus Lucifugimonas marina]|uniref:Glycosyltransferase n=1 Tax=Candidatus Lucifugimonas marina TaxID=3038979 RepID=A0AAJ5ZHD8_9CHLR|nr:glycosyltransferase [SAR202 cluster bacterium JH702]MDG0868226.1 glycosyltransferase [SAR202 cluster bacterium JH639]WFG34870.1 glycosyltransferase [SAR202 cluster bacterium JH545]WFG38821.1 glycosyltransferase [SAR202 cluster bacterium JH1073]